MQSAFGEEEPIMKCQAANRILSNSCATALLALGATIAPIPSRAALGTEAQAAPTASVVLTKVQGTTVTVPQGTRIDVQLEQPLSSQTAKTNDTFAFVVKDPVVVDGMLVIAQGAEGQGHIADARKAAFLGRSGMLTLTYDWVVGEDGEKIHVTGVDGSVGGGNLDTSLAAGAAGAVASAFVPFAGFAGLVVRGKKAEIGTQDSIRIYVEDTVHILSDERARFDDGFAH
jgi:hypothetical protein